jgi:hypothetical protein
MFKPVHGVIAGVVLLAAMPMSSAQAQWVFVARKVIGRISQMEQPSHGADPGYSVANIVLDADARRVFQAVSQHIHANPELRVVDENSNTGIIHFARGPQTAGITVVAMNPKAAQMIVVAPTVAGQPSPMPLLVSGIERVCAQLKKQCSVQ